MLSEPHLQVKMALGVLWSTSLPHFFKMLGVALPGPEQCSRLAKLRTPCSHPTAQVPSPACLAASQTAGKQASTNCGSWLEE